MYHQLNQTIIPNFNLHAPEHHRGRGGMLNIVLGTATTIIVINSESVYSHLGGTGCIERFL